MQVLLLAMLEPRSYTAEDVIEIHTHGGGISAQRVLQVGRSHCCRRIRGGRSRGCAEQSGRGAVAIRAAVQLVKAGPSILLQRCLEAGARLARPGEFTLRAFLNGRLDLSQAESVAQVRALQALCAAAGCCCCEGLC